MTSVPFSICVVNEHPFETNLPYRATMKIIQEAYIFEKCVTLDGDYLGDTTKSAKLDRFLC